MEFLFVGLIAFVAGLACNRWVARRITGYRPTPTERIARAIRDGYRIPVTRADVEANLTGILAAAAYESAERVAASRGSIPTNLFDD